MEAWDRFEQAYWNNAWKSSKKTQILKQNDHKYYIYVNFFIYKAKYKK